ncbi:MAG TPA: VCBS repeat-containing protein [Candidatus Didemnitutus sp.]
MKTTLRAGAIICLLLFGVSLQAQYLGDRVIWSMSGTTNTGSTDLGAVETFWRIAGAGDFDGDGKTDLLWENVETGEHAIWLMSGTSLSSVVPIAPLSTDWRVATVGEFNGDGEADILFENMATGDRKVWISAGGSFTSSTFATIPPEWHIAACGNFGGGYGQDLMWENTNDGDRAIWYMHYTGGSLTQIGSPYFTNVSTDWRIAAFGDFNGDGYTDLVWENVSTGDRAIWEITGTTVLSTPYLLNLTNDWRIAAAGPFHGGTQADIVWEYVPGGDEDLDGLMDGWEQTHFTQTGVDANSTTVISSSTDNIPYSVKAQLGMQTAALAVSDGSVALKITKPQ